jgi:glutamyl/glutaminyl-tRNA synthetase
MLIYNTRFVPTLSGPPHLGHVYNILVNQTEAHKTGGKFGVRFDDSQRAWLWDRGGREEIDRYRNEWCDDLNWLGIKLDWVSSQSELMPRTEELAQFLDKPLPKDSFGDIYSCEVVGLKINPYPASYRLTAEHVLMDFLEHVNLVIRGLDLLSEDCAYDIIRKDFELPQVRRVYIPRLQFDGDEVSKTLAKFKVADFRNAGMLPSEIFAMLAGDCLIYEPYEWTLDNILPCPTLGKWAEEAMR